MTAVSRLLELVLVLINRLGISLNRISSCIKVLSISCFCDWLEAGKLAYYPPPPPIGFAYVNPPPPPIGSVCFITRLLLLDPISI